MGAEENHNIVPVAGGETRQTILNRLAHRLDEPGMDRPAVDDAPLKGIQQTGSPRGAPELVQAGSGGTAGELRILREGDGALDSIGVHLPKRLVAGGPGISKGDVKAVGRRFWGEAVQASDHAPTLGFGVPEYRRATSDVGVEAFHLRRSSPRDERTEPALEGKLNDLPIREELQQERLDVVEGRGPAEIEHDNPGFGPGARGAGRSG